MSDNPIKDLEAFAKDALYAAVGLGVLGFQKAQVRRREIAEALAERGVDVGGQVRAAGQTLRPSLENLRPSLENLRPPLENLRPQIDAVRPNLDALRPPVEAIGTELRAAAIALRPQVESLGAGIADLLKTLDEHAAPVRREVDARVSDIEEHLPPGARAGFAQLRARAAGPEETVRWLIGVLEHMSQSSGAAGEGGGKDDAGEPAPGGSAEEPRDAEPPATE